MKNHNLNSRIKFTNEEIELIKNAIQDWIQIDIDKFRGTGVERKQQILNYIKLKTVNVKKEYSLNMNYKQLMDIMNIISEAYTEYKIDMKISKSTVEKIFILLQNNYKIEYWEICYPDIQWV